MFFNTLMTYVLISQSLFMNMFGDISMGVINTEMVEVARRVAAASEFTGSGVAGGVLCPDGLSVYHR